MSYPSDSIPTSRRAAPPFALSLGLCLILVCLFTWMRLFVFNGDKVFPIASALPLLLCLWNRDLRLLYGMSVCFSVISILRVVNRIPDGASSTAYDYFSIAGQLANIWLVAGVIHGLLKARDRVELRNSQLHQANRELEGSNLQLADNIRELSLREEEILRQNEELQSQTEELEQQSEELRQQSEEMIHQSNDLQAANAELARREKAMLTLLNSARMLRAEEDQTAGMNSVCQAALQVMEEGTKAAAIIAADSQSYQILGHAGFGLQGVVKSGIFFAESYSALILESCRTAAVNDLSERPDLKVPRPSAGRPFRAVLGCPVWNEGHAVAVLEVYREDVYEWTEHEFLLIEWLAAQAGLALQSARFQQELQRKRSDAEESSRQKTRFLAAVSHDVRTPANAISLLAELIEKCALDPARIAKVPELAKSLWTNAQSLVDLVSDVLDLTRLDSGGIDVDVTTFSLNELIAREVEQVRPLATDHGLAIQSRLPDTAPMLSSDRVKLRRVLANLLSNAVKFTEHGEIRVDCIPSETGMAIHIVDTGMGIPREHLEHIFDEFFQLRNPERNREKGAGLGLAICRRLVDAMGFEMRVSSLVGIGTTFTLAIPARCLSDGLTKPSPALPLEIPAGGGSTSPASLDPHQTQSLAGMKILLVEDHDTARETTEELLATEGAQVATAANGREAIQHLEQSPPELLLLDLNLPDFDGAEVLEHLASRRAPGLRWILVITGDARPERVEQVRALGADALIPKPVSIEKIRSHLRKEPTTMES